MKFDLATMPPTPGFKDDKLSELRYSDNYRHFINFRQILRDGADIDIRITTYEDNPPSFSFHIKDKGSCEIWLLPEVEKFILTYMLSGKNTGSPSYPQDGAPIPYRAEKDYLYKHIKREIIRKKYGQVEVTKDGINGVRFIARYPYGRIDYGFIPTAWEELNKRLETVEPYHYSIEENDIPKLQSSPLEVEERELKEGCHLDSVFEDGLIPSNIILNKTICGCGATWLEIHSKRNSIIIEPNIPVIIGKQQQHPNIIGVYGDGITSGDIANEIRKKNGFIKIFTTPDSYPKIAQALKQLKIPYKKDWFLLFDECEKIITDIDYRQNIILPIEDFFAFENKAMVSATPIIINDPRFKEQGFRVIKIKPDFDHKQTLELKPTNNVNLMVKRTLEQFKETPHICLFYNSVQGITELIDYLKIHEQTNIYCSKSSKKSLKKEGVNAHDTLTDEAGAINLNKYNFFTSRFYSAVDIKLDYKPVVIMISQVYKTLPHETPYSLIDAETEAIQIAGRFRNGIDRLIHIANTNSKLPYQDKEELEQFLDEQHSGYHKLLELKKRCKDRGETHIIGEAIENTSYTQKGFVTAKGEKNYFRYNNAYLDERLKMLYRYPACLYKTYERSGAFNVISDAEYMAYTDDERRKLLKKNTDKAERITSLNEILSRSNKSTNPFERQFIEELKREYGLYIEALATIGFRKVKSLGFKDSDVTTAVNEYNFLKAINSDAVKKDVYSVFKANTTYPTAFIRKELLSIFNTHNLKLNRKIQGKDITHFFGAGEERTRKERIWRLRGKR